MSQFSINNESPSGLYRAFDELAYAENLAHRGELRLRLVQSYRAIKDPSRRDESEGEIRIRVETDEMQTLHLEPSTLRTLGSSTGPGVLHYSGEYLSPVYVLCMSSPSVELGFLRSKMGPHIVRILDSEEFVQRVAAALVPSPLSDRKVCFVDLVPVTYTKGKLGKKPDGNDMIRMSYAQKPQEFAAECEHRLAVGFGGPLRNAPENFSILLSDPTEFLELLPSG